MDIRGASFVQLYLININIKAISGGRPEIVVNATLGLFLLIQTQHNTLRLVFNYSIKHNVLHTIPLIDWDWISV